MRLLSKDIKRGIRLRQVATCANCIHAYGVDADEEVLACQKFDFWTEYDYLCDHHIRQDTINTHRA